MSHSFPTTRSSYLYESILDEVLSDLTADKLGLAQDLAQLPDSVRGYGPVKERFLAHARERQALLLEQWRNGTGAAFHDASRTTGKIRSEEHTSELQSLMRISYSVFCVKKKK